MFIDSHAHLDMPEYDNDREEIITHAKEDGVDYIVTIGTDIESSRKAIELSIKHENVYATVGVHPHDVSFLYKDGKEEDHYKEIRQLLNNSKIAGYGEIGLDFHYNHSPQEIQIKGFRDQIRVAKEFSLPLIIHSREAENETIRIMDEESAWDLGGVLHCFSGSIEMARKAIERGFFISFAGIVTFDKAKNIHDLVKEISLENIIIETDAPFLAPVPFRGKRNEPKFVRNVAEKISYLKGLTIEEVARVTSFNSKRLFGIGKNEETIAYQIGDSLYLNITNRCTDACRFCIRYYSDYLRGHNLRLNKEPDIKKIIDAMGDISVYKEIVFCGYGEPLIRLDVVKEVSKWVKEKGGRIRIDTNGQGNIIHNRNILPELKGLVDEISISLNTENKEKYYELCRPRFGIDTYDKIKEFAMEAKRYIPMVTVTVVDLPNVEIERCKKIASEELGVNFRIRPRIPVNNL